MIIILNSFSIGTSVSYSIAAVVMYSDAKSYIVTPLNPDQLSWVVSIMKISFMCFILSSGFFNELLGRKKTLLIGQFIIIKGRQIVSWQEFTSFWQPDCQKHQLFPKICLSASDFWPRSSASGPKSWKVVVLFLAIFLLTRSTMSSRSKVISHSIVTLKYAELIRGHALKSILLSFLIFIFFPQKFPSGNPKSLGFVLENSREKISILENSRKHSKLAVKITDSKKFATKPLNFTKNDSFSTN